MSNWFFATDLHGSKDRYMKLFKAIEREKPAAVLLGGDLFPSGLQALVNDAKEVDDFLEGFLLPHFLELKKRLKADYPRVCLILGNDDGLHEEAGIINAEKYDVWDYIHNKRVLVDGIYVYGYAFVPPTPFQLKDLERYDVSRYTPHGSLSPEEGFRTQQVLPHQVRYATISADLEELIQDADVTQAVFLFHTPPYDCNLDRAALDGQQIDHVPLNLHVGSIAVRRFIEARSPLVTLHGHIHESARITGAWQDTIGLTPVYSAAHDGPELALVRFDPHLPQNSSRELL